MPLLYIPRYITFIYALRRTSAPSSGSLTFTFRFFATTAGCKHLSKCVGTNLDIWLAMYHGISFLLLPTWYTNFLFIHINYIKLNFSTCFELNPLIIKRSTIQIVHMQPLVSSLSASDRLVQPLRKDRVTIPQAEYVQFESLTSWWWPECARNM